MILLQNMLNMYANVNIYFAKLYSEICAKLPGICSASLDRTGSFADLPREWTRYMLASRHYSLYAAIC